MLSCLEQMLLGKKMKIHLSFWLLSENECGLGFSSLPDCREEEMCWKNTMKRKSHTSLKAVENSEESKLQNSGVWRALANIAWGCSRHVGLGEVRPSCDTGGVGERDPEAHCAYSTWRNKKWQHTGLQETGSLTHKTRLWWGLGFDTRKELGHRDKTRCS